MSKIKNYMNFKIIRKRICLFIIFILYLVCDENLHVVCDESLHVLHLFHIVL